MTTFMQQTEVDDKVISPGIDQPKRPPSLPEILALKTVYDPYYETFHRQCEEEERYYFGRNAVPHPEGIEPVNPPTAYAIVNTATDHVDVNNISIDVDNPRAKARAERIKKFLIGFWMNIRSPVKRDAVAQANTYGISFLKIMWMPDLWPDKPPPLDEFDSDEAYRDALDEFMERRSISFPFQIMNANPKNLVWDDSRTGIKWVIESYERTDADAVRGRYAGWGSVKKNGEPFTWLEYWDETYCVYVADNEVVWAGEHDYGFQPYVPVFPARTVGWDVGEPEQRYRGILRPVHSLLDEKARALTAYNAILRMFAWRTLDFTGPQALAERAAKNYELFAAKNILPSGVTVTASPLAMPPQELLTYIEKLDTEIEMATFPNSVRGVRPRGVSSGFGISVLAGMGRLVFQGIADGMARAIEEANIRVLKLIENKARGKMTVSARSDVHNFDQSIGPDDIRGMYENRVTLKAEAPEEREREAILAMQLWKSGMISLYEAQRRAGIVNPLDEQLLMGAERLINSPETQLAQQQYFQEGLALLNQLAQAAGGNPADTQFQPGLSQLQRPGENFIQQQRVSSQQGTPSVFPNGLSGIDLLGRQLGQSIGGAVGQPNGSVVR